MQGICREKTDSAIIQVGADISRRTTEQRCLGKYLALMAAAVVPLLLGALVGLLVVGTSGAVGIQWNYVGGIGTFLLFACVFVSLIVLLSLFVSTATHRSAIAALILLAIWAFWTLTLRLRDETQSWALVGS